MYVKVVSKKGDFAKAKEFLLANMGSFGMELEAKKLMMRITNMEGDKIGTINELINIIKHNYEQLDGDF